MSHGLPTESVDVTGATFTDPERGRDRARHLSTAAIVVAAIAWLVVLFIAVNGSERDGITASWFAIFPSGFGLAGRIALGEGASAKKALGVAFLTGTVASLLLWFFFETLWHSL